MSNQRLLAVLAVIVTVVALVVVRSGDSDPDEHEAVHTPSESEATGEVSNDAPKAPKKSGKKGRIRRVKHRPVEPGETRLSCPECNVMVISIDGLRADHMGTYGYTRATTPRLDKFAKNSSVFGQAYSQSSWKAPAISSMFTGLLPREHGVLFHPNPGPLSEKADTLASHLAKAGYHTAGFHGGGYITKSMGKGFEKWKSSGRTFKSNLEAARDWLVGHGHERFFMFLQGYDMQKPFVQTALNTFHKPQGTYDMLGYCKRGSERVLEGDELQYVVAQYDASAVAVDKEVGGFLNFVRDKKLLENTIVVITAAHGEELFEHGGCDHKQSVYNELVRVPLIMHVPSKVRKRTAEPVAASISLKPTLLGMLGLAEGLDTSLDLRAVLDRKAKQPAIVNETGATRPQDKPGAAKVATLGYYRAAVTADNFKLVYQRNGTKDTWELYDLKADPGEKTDIAAKNAAQVATLKAVLFPPKGKPSIPTLPKPVKKGAADGGEPDEPEDAKSDKPATKAKAATKEPAPKDPKAAKP
jgi:choline-sulfatase